MGVRAKHNLLANALREKGYNARVRVPKYFRSPSELAAEHAREQTPALLRDAA